MEDLGIKWLKRFSAGLFKASWVFPMYPLSWKENVGKCQLIESEINPIFAWSYIRGSQVKMNT